MSNKYFNTSKYKRDEERKEKLMTAFVYSVLGFAFIGVMFTFSFTITTIMGWVL